MRKRSRSGMPAVRTQPVCSVRGTHEAFHSSLWSSSSPFCSFGCRMKPIGAVLALLAGIASAHCPNFCNGHGASQTENMGSMITFNGTFHQVAPVGDVRRVPTHHSGAEPMRMPHQQLSSTWGPEINSYDLRVSFIVPSSLSWPLSAQDDARCGLSSPDGAPPGLLGPLALINVFCSPLSSQGPNKCSCFSKWDGGDCSIRAWSSPAKGELMRGPYSNLSLPHPTGTCPTGTAWSAIATADDTGHISATCSNRGECNEETGICACMTGFEGVACNRSASEPYRPSSFSASLSLTLSPSFVCRSINSELSR